MFPDSSKTSTDLDTYKVFPKYGRTPSALSTLSHDACESIVPNDPVDAPIKPSGLVASIRFISSGGRDNQSMVFLNTPGIELLYSGVDNNIPSEEMIKSFKLSTASGIPSISSTSALYRGISSSSAITRTLF